MAGKIRWFEAPAIRLVPCHIRLPIEGADGSAIYARHYDHVEWVPPPIPRPEEVW